MRASVLLVFLAVSASLAAQPALAKSAKGKSKVDDSKYYDIKNDAVQANDPWEAFNRPIFDFNLGFDRVIAKPITSVYDELPGEVRHSVSNFLSNLSEPLNTIHGVLQLNPKVAFTSFWRFILNTTFGLAGIFDFAREEGGLRNMDQNLGKTLGNWGVGAGPYIVLPVVGPSSLRDTTGKIGDWFADPVSYVFTTPETVAQVVMDGIDARSRNDGVIEHLYYQSLDPYTATRSAYRQHESFEASKRE